MRVALLHNTSAGSEDHTDDELIKLIGRAGHEVVHVVNRSSALTAALQASPCDLVAVAGGDGTVGRVACELSDWGIPLGILPLGTANNTALTLGLSATSMKTLIKGWGTGAKLPFDLALLDDGTVRQRFSEGIGWGVFAATVNEAKARPALDRPTRQLKRDRKLFRGIAESMTPRPYRIEADGRDCSGDYLLVEIMNVPFLGPQLEVSPSSNPGDGELELVLAGAEQRDSLEALGRTGKSAKPLPCERGKHIRVRATDGLMHRDGTLLRHAPGERNFEISVCPGAVYYLR